MHLLSHALTSHGNFLLHEERRTTRRSMVQPMAPEVERSNSAMTFYPHHQNPSLSACPYEAQLFTSVICAAS